MYLRRKIDDYLTQWKNNENRYPLIIKGARQIGKTESVKHFADRNYESVVSINFALEKQFQMILSDGYDVENIIKNISLIDPSKKFIANRTLIIFKKIHSNSVGYKTDYEMFSMDFEEFLWAKGYSESHVNEMLEHMTSGKPFSKTELMVYKKLFLEYCVLGGMPAVVKQFIETNTFSETLEIQRQIQLDYEEDIRKYADVSIFLYFLDKKISGRTKLKFKEKTIAVFSIFVLL